MHLETESSSEDKEVETSSVSPRIVPTPQRGGIPVLAGFIARLAEPPLLTNGLSPSSLVFLSWKGTHVGLSAAVERGPSEGARSGSTGPTWVPFHPPSSCAFREQEDDQATR